MVCSIKYGIEAQKCSFADTVQVCPDPTISRDGPIMLQRAMQILTEASQVWPLAARWLENLEKFYRDNKGAIPGIEGSMDDSVRVTQLLENVAAPCLT